MSRIWDTGGIAESGLIYMRARYYEPGTGRFISQDPGRDGWNWFGYAANSPVTKHDVTGKEATWDDVLRSLFGTLTYGAGIALLMASAAQAALAITPAEVTSAIQFARYSLIFMTMAINGMDIDWYFGAGLTMLDWFVIDKWLAASVASTAIGSKTKAAPAVQAAFVYGLLVTAFLLNTDWP